MGYLKTLTLVLWTPTMDQDCGPPHRPVHIPPLWTPPMDHPQNGTKIINKDDTHGLSNGLLVSVKFQMLHCANVTDLGSGSGTNYIITHCHFLCCGYI